MLFLHRSRIVLTLLTATYSVPLAAQAFSQVSVAGQGYQLPSNTITAAPGQVMTVSVFGAQVRLTGPVTPTAGADGLPTTVNGISAEFAQGNLTVALPIRALQQSACPSFGGCAPSTSLTVQIPFEMTADPLRPAVVRVKEGGHAFTELAVKVVSDNVHIVSSCDQTGIYLSLAADVPAGTCAPMIMHARGPLVSMAAPAVPGETLVVWAYGLGALNQPMPTAIQPFVVSASYLDANRFPFKRLNTAEPPYVGMTGAGMYQVHVVVPEVPGDAAVCTPRSGNVQITVSGPSSADGAEICVAGSRWFNTTELQNNFNSR